MLGVHAHRLGRCDRKEGRIENGQVLFDELGSTCLKLEGVSYLSVGRIRNMKLSWGI